MWDVAIVGAGPAGAAAALGALTADPGLRVLLLDRTTFPRDKACGDGIAPHVLDVLSELGVHGLLDDWTPVRRLVVQASGSAVDRSMRRPAYVVPRAVFDARLVERAVRAGADLRQHRVRQLHIEPTRVELDGGFAARVVIGADGAGSAVRAAMGLRPHRHRALALRGYAPPPTNRRSRQLIVFGAGRQPAYAWSFDRGDGLANVGYGELLSARRPAPTRRHLLTELDRLLPGALDGGDHWLGHHLPLSSWRWRHPAGPVLLAGDAAGLVNPITGEGIYYAVATGVAAGHSAVASLGGDDPSAAGAIYRQKVRRLLARHLASTAAGSRLLALPPVAAASLRAGQRDSRTFDALVELGLGRGSLGPRIVGSVIRALG